MIDSIRPRTTPDKLSSILLSRFLPKNIYISRYYSGMSGRASLANAAKGGTPVLEKLARSLAQTVHHMEVSDLSVADVAVCLFW